jgi:serine/threonine protein kinase/tetratricopeptide (TPR) repeat protein
MLEASTKLGPYEIVASLGAGGMGEVYRARDTRLGREVAIKVLPEPFATNPDRQGRFEREARAVAALSHPNILAIHDYGTQGSVTYAVMELLEGETLRARLAKGPLSWREAVEIGAAIADGLAAAHAKGIIHRDLKPENLFLTADGRVKILDFGLARITPLLDSQGETGPYISAETDPGAVMGTVGYMSPEQVRGLPADARSDLFSFGCVMYEMVAGVRAFQRETGAETMTAILHDEPPDLTISGHLVPAELGRIIRHCLAKSPNQRLQSAHDLALGLRATASDPALRRLPVARHSSRRLIAVIVGALLISATGVSAYLLTRGSNRPDNGKPSGDAKAIEAIAILPFENVGNDPDAENVSDGIPESIIRSLYEVHSLRVRPFSSVSRFKGRGKDLDLQEVGRQLKVQAVLTGTLTPQKNGFSLSVELVDVRDLSGLWSGQYDRERTPVQRMPEEIAKQVCVKLGLKLTAEEEKRLSKRYTDNSEAYQLYLKGRYFWNKRTEEGMKKGVEYFNQSIEKDSAYTLAYAGLADSYVQLANYGFAAPKEAMPKAKESALKALDIDEKLAEAHTALGFISERYDWNWLEAERRYKRAIELNRNYPTAHLWYAYHLGDRRRFDDALAESRRAQELDPLWLMGSATVGWVFYFARQYDEAVEQFQKTLEIDPHFWVAHDYLARVYYQKGMYDEAIATFRKANTLSPATPVLIAELGYTQAVLGKRSEAEKALQELKELSTRRYVPAFWFAFLFSGLGEKDRAVEWLEKAFEERSGVFGYLEAEPMFDRFRSDPRVMDFLWRIGTADKTAARDQAIHSVAVLPFKNDSGDPKTEYLSDGVAEQIINNLSQVRRKDLIVRPFTSVVRYRGKELDIQKFGRELKVQMIVTGTLRQDGEKLTISVAVVDVEKDSQIWGDRYPDKPRDTILDVQDKIARDVAANLRLQLTGEEEHRLTKRYTDDPEAYLLYREAIYHFNKFSEEGLATAIDYCQQAIKKDPNYALAYTAAGRCHILRGTQFRGIRETGPEARKAIEQALRIDKALPEAHAALGGLQLFEWNWDAAEHEFKQAIAIDPHFYGFWLAAHGRLPEALASIRREQQLDPLAPGRRFEVALCYNWMRQYDQAIDEAQEALALDSKFVGAYRERGLALSQKGLHKQALVELQTGVELSKRNPEMLGLLGYGCVAARKSKEAAELLEELLGLAQKGRYGNSFAIARIYAAQGQKDKAFEWLRKACDEHDPRVIWLKVDPTLDNLRKEPEFAKVLKDMRLPP